MMTDPRPRPDDSPQTAGPEVFDPTFTERYSRQIAFEPLGLAGQQALAQARVLLIGCGALGSASARMLVQAGVELLRICDPDRVELHNLQRQTLYDEADVRQRRFKAEAARRRLLQINSSVQIQPIVTTVTAANIASFTQGIDLLIDGSDNFAIRYLINDQAHHSGRPWLYGAVAGATGVTMPVIPGKTACLRCLMPEAPTADQTATAQTHGVLPTIVTTVAARQVMAAMQILTGHTSALNTDLVSTDLWAGRTTSLSVPPDPECVCCQQGRYQFLER